MNEHIFLVISCYGAQNNTVVVKLIQSDESRQAVTEQSILANLQCISDGK